MSSIVELRFISILVCTVILLFESFESSQTNENKPNIIIILADDMVINLSKIRINE